MPSKTKEDIIWARYKSAHRTALKALKSLPFTHGHTPNVSGLNGWVFERVIISRVIRELRKRGINPKSVEQSPFASRAKADIRLDSILIEIKLQGIFGPDNILKYRRLALAAKRSGMTYIYLTGGENCKPYRDGMTRSFGKANAFFLDRTGDWDRFISRLVSLLKRNKRLKARSAPA